MSQQRSNNNSQNNKQEPNFPAFMRPVDLSIGFIDLKNSPPIALDDITKKPISTLAKESNPFERSFSQNINSASSVSSREMSLKAVSVSNGGSGSSGSSNEYKLLSDSSFSQSKATNSLGYGLPTDLSNLQPSVSNGGFFYHPNIPSNAHEISSYNTSQSPAVYIPPNTPIPQGYFAVPASIAPQLFASLNMLQPQHHLQNHAFSNNSSYDTETRIIHNHSPQQADGRHRTGTAESSDTSRTLSLQERNRIAAQKCREKKRRQQLEMEATYHENMKSNEIMEGQALALQNEITKIKQLLDTCKDCTVAESNFKRFR